jgi:competence protein ComEC
MEVCKFFRSHILQGRQLRMQFGWLSIAIFCYFCFILITNQNSPKQVKWNAFPFLFLTPLLIIGILWNDYYKNTISLEFYIFVFFIIIVVLFALRRSAARLPAGVLLCLGFVLLGHFSAHLFRYVHQPPVSSETLNQATFFTAVIDSKPVKTAKTNRYEARIQKVKLDEKWQTLEARAVLYAVDNQIFSYGDMLLIQGHPAFLPAQKNPHAFDYSLFLKRKGIYLQAFCNKHKTLILGEEGHDAWRYLALSLGDVFDDILSTYIYGDRELNMARAMAIGRRSEIAPEMDDVYKATGTSHILAVSGLHVGIIFLVISSAFKFAKRKGLKWVYYSVVLFSIWSFAFITGLSPSVRRAALMLSFIVVAEMIRRKSNIYNTLLASAFCILLFSPNLIYSVSFQFSYTAVLGIVYFYKKIYAFLYLKNRIFDFFWQITVLSISVQLATFAINIYYFHSFPALFFLTNLFAIPTAIVVVIGSLTIFSTSFLPYIPDLTGMLVEKWVFVYNEIMVFFSHLELTSIERLSLKGAHVFLIMMLVFALARFIEYRKLAVFRLFVMVLCLLAAIVLYDNYKLARQVELVVYATNHQRYVDVFFGNTCYTNVTKPDKEGQQAINYNIQPNRDYHLIQDLKSMNDLPSARSVGDNEILMLGNTSILFINNTHGLSAKLHGLQIDVLVIGRQGIQWLQGEANSFAINNIVLDDSLRSWEIDEISAIIPSEVRIHAIDRDGAFVLRI